MTRRADGFSLVEALVTVLLASVLAGIAVPMVAQGMKLYTINSAGQQVSSTIRAARFQAVARNRVHYVRFDFPADGQYQVREMVAGVEQDAGDVQLLPNGITFADGATDVEIKTSGRVEAASVITVTNGTAEQDKTITVSTSGRVQLQ